MAQDKYLAPHLISNSHEHFEQVALGNIPFVDFVYKFGSNESVSSTEEVVAYGGAYGLPLTAQRLIVTSNSGLDIPGGSGARSVVLEGLDINYNEIKEIVPLGGTSVQSFLRCPRAYVEECGNNAPTGGANQGIISITQAVSGVLMILIGPNEGQTLCAGYTVPAGYAALVWNIDATTGEGKNALVRFKVRLFNGTHAFRVKGIRYSYQNTVKQEFRIPQPIPEKSELIVTCVSTAAGTPITATMQIELIKLA